MRHRRITVAKIGNLQQLEEVCDESIPAEGIDSFEDQVQVCFSTTTGLFSWWIRWFTGSPVSHSLLSFRSETLGKVCVMESHGSGFRIVPWASWETRNTLIARFTLSCPSEAQLKALRALSNRLGDPYDVRALFGFVPGLWYRVKNAVVGRWRVRNQGSATRRHRSHWLPRFRNFLDNPKRLFCSEAIAEFLLFATSRAEFDRPQDWSPKNLFDYAAHTPEVFTLVDNDLNSARTKERQQGLPPHIWEYFSDLPCSIEPGEMCPEDIEKLRVHREALSKPR